MLDQYNGVHMKCICGRCCQYTGNIYQMPGTIVSTTLVGEDWQPLPHTHTYIYIWHDKSMCMCINLFIIKKVSSQNRVFRSVVGLRYPFKHISSLSNGGFAAKVDNPLRSCLTMQLTSLSLHISFTATSTTWSTTIFFIGCFISEQGPICWNRQIYYPEYAKY